MNLSTVGSNLQPTSRIVLMKSFDKQGFVFNTNMKSNKSKDIEHNALVSLNFHWKSLNKQVRIGRPVHVEGLAEATGGGAFATCAGMLTYAASGLANNDVGIIASFDRGGSSLANIGRWLRENL